MTKGLAAIGRRWRAKSIAMLRSTPLHPQWLIGGRDASSAMLRRYASGTVLDVGCANQWVVPHLATSCHYIGLDSLAMGVELYRARPDLIADADRLPIADSAVQTVLLFEVLEHLRRPADALAECARVLAPGGTMLLSMPFLYPVHDAPSDFQRLTRYGLERDLVQAGFCVEAIDAELSAFETAALLGSLAAGGTVFMCWRERSPWLIASPLLAMWVVFSNLMGWVAGNLLPNWQPMTIGHLLVARKP